MATLILLAFIRGEWAATQHESREYFLAPDGDDSNEGTLESPWRTLGHGLKQLVPGDVLTLRGGVYYENELIITLQGTASAPITIQSYPGERAVIDGGIPDFREAPNSAWEAVGEPGNESGSEASGLYRSTNTYTAKNGFVGAWLLASDTELDAQLLEYEAAHNLESMNFGPLDGLAPIYVGPGIQFRPDVPELEDPEPDATETSEGGPSTGHIYIRLESNPNDLQDANGNPIPPVPANTDPNQNRLAVFFSQYIFLLEGASYLIFKDIDLVHARTLVDARNGTNHITFSGCRLYYGTRALVIRDNIYKWEISGCEFNNGLPNSVYWTDVKNRDVDVTEAYPEFQSTAIDGALNDFYIHHNLFRNLFDAITVEDNSADTRIMYNVFVQTLDDAINLSRGIRNVEVAHNLLYQVMGGIANLSSVAEPGHVYIHHNLIDNSTYQRGGRVGNYREHNWPRWTIGSPFPDHDAGNRSAWWKLYNNTIVTREDNGHRWSAAGPDNVTGNPEKYVLNNIFYVLGERVVFRNDLAASGSHYDGNVFFSQSLPGPGEEPLPLFTDFGDGGRYDSLQAFRAATIPAGIGWELRGLQTDPGFRLDLMSDPPSTDMAALGALWEHYRPTNYRVGAPGASYEGLPWPETEYSGYRGALPMSSQRPLFLPALEMNPTPYPYP